MNAVYIESTDFMTTKIRQDIPTHEKLPERTQDNDAIYKECQHKRRRIDSNNVSSRMEPHLQRNPAKWKPPLTQMWWRQNPGDSSSLARPNLLE